MKRRIPVEQLKPGMHLLGLDQSWFKSPLWFHRGPVKSYADIRQLMKSGVREVTIDTEQGPDVQDSACESGILKTQGSIEPSPMPGLAEMHHEPPGVSEEDEVNESLGKSFDLDTFEEELYMAQGVRSEAISSIKRVFEGIKTGVALESGPLQNVTQTLFDCIKAREGCVLADAQLQRMMQFDASLFSHAVDVCVGLSGGVSVENV